ncbi:tetratricopeptide repeat protein [Polynucleobacter sp. AP-Kolm-20A-A1]|nr:tetratricopeptide repeat protein [Polynucleobacter sp. AP-Kolm-20A-A1]
MSQFYTPAPMPVTLPAPRPNLFKLSLATFAISLVMGCSTTAQQVADAEIKAVNSQELKCGPNSPYLGSGNPGDAQKLTTDVPYNPSNPELSETVALPFLSFLIIEPDPVTKNAVPSDVEKLVKARKFPEAIELIDAHLKKTPKNVQLRFLRARLQIEMKEYGQAKKTLIVITQQFPELPEPYNNLAAIAANEGKWIEARDYLELALKLRPSYAVASANLGEVYVRLGAQAYEDASKSAQLNQRQYSNKAKALMSLIKTPSKDIPTNTPSTNLPESRSQ